MNAAKQYRYGFHQGGREELPARVVPRNLDLGHIEGLFQATTWELPVIYYGENFTERSNALACSITTCGHTFDIFAAKSAKWPGTAHWDIFATSGNREYKIILVVSQGSSNGSFNTYADMDPDTAAAIAGKMTLALHRFQEIRYSRSY